MRGDSGDRFTFADAVTAVACVAMIVLVIWLLWSVSE